MAPSRHDLLALVVTPAPQRTAFGDCNDMESPGQLNKCDGADRHHHGIESLDSYMVLINGNSNSTVEAVMKPAI